MRTDTSLTDEQWSDLLDRPEPARPAAIEVSAVPLSYRPPSSRVPEKAPLEWARAFLRDYFAHPHRPTIARWRGETFVWRRGAWRRAGTEEITREAYAWADAAVVEDDKGMPAPFRPNRQKVSDLLHAAFGLVAVDDEIEMPGLLGPYDLDPDNAMAVSNGILDLRTRTLLPHSPRFFSQSCVDYPFIEQPNPPKRWLKFLNDLWPDDPDSIAALGEWFGMLLTSDTSSQKILLIIGPKRAGKGTLGRVLRGSVGQDALVAPTLSGLSTPFGLAPLIGKRVALISDARLSGRSDLAIIAERLLSISGEDVQTVDRKHLAAWTGTLRTRFVVMTNELPALKDASGALASRFIILNLKRSFYGHEDARLSYHLVQDLPGILWWSLDGLDRFRARGRFTEPASSSDDRSDLDRLTSPIAAFVADEAIPEPHGRELISAVFDRWKAWCLRQGMSAGTEASLSKNLKSVISTLETDRKMENGNRARYFVGIRLA